MKVSIFSFFVFLVLLNLLLGCSDPLSHKVFIFLLINEYNVYEIELTWNSNKNDNSALKANRLCRQWKVKQIILFLHEMI